MCQSKADGGRRCPETPTTRALRSMRGKLRRAQNSGDTDKASQLDNQVQLLEQAREKYGPIVSDLSLPVPAKIAKLLDVLRDSGGNPLIVGGSVRDAISGGGAPKDFDIEVHGQDMDDIAASLRKAGYPVDLVGRQFGVIKTRAGGEEIDLSVPRKDSLTGSGHRGFTVETDADLGVREAAARRDFTINAMMYDHSLKAAIDPYGGREDLNNGVLRHVSDAFGEDPLRPLRGFQFASRYNLTMDPDTAKVCQGLRARSGEISKERIKSEWAKFFSKSSRPSAGLAVLRQMKWDDTVPGLNSVNESAVDKANELRRNDSPDRRMTLVAATMMDTMDEKDAARFSTATIEASKPRAQAITLGRARAPQTTDRASMRKWTRELGKKELTVQDWVAKEKAFGRDNTAQFNAVVASAKAEGVYDKAPTVSLMGRDLMDLFPDRNPGPWVGQALSKALDAEDKGEFTDNDGARKWALQNC